MSDHPTCRAARLLPGAFGNFCTLPPAAPVETLCAALRHAPQFAGLDLDALLTAKPLRLLILGRNDCVPRQLAAYLTRIRDLAAQPDPNTKLNRMSGAELCISSTDSRKAPTGPALLCTDVSRWGVSGPGSPNDWASALLFCASSGAVLTPELLELLPVLCHPGGRDLYLVIKESQMDRETVEELRFTQGFQVCQVGEATEAALCAMLEQALSDSETFLAPDVSPSSVVEAVRRFRGGRFEDGDLEQAVENAVKRHFGVPLQIADFLPPPLPGQKDGLTRLNRMIGLEPVKQVIHRRIAADRLQAHRGTEPLARNLAFAGPPGTGKTETSRLLAQILREEGCGSGRFVEAGREQLVGQYLGHTSAKVAQCFQEAKGGVLFIDEAGALLDPDGRDSFAQEAVNALVRHMENDRDTMVILATYPDQMERLLHTNPGLSSRIAKVIHFTDYSPEELWDILAHLAARRGYVLPEEVRQDCQAFFRELRDRKGVDFGNGREARRLLETALETVGLRFLDHPEAPDVLLPEDLRQAAEELLAQVNPKPQARPIGFLREA